ncbi:RRM_1 domain-containing protein/SPOC domain-containing protein/RRM_5 domain-containing protein [Cephalotus follicularis]|uniref:RRM_1 domain-containing protein/SPOC domain-containing protein/RRM_5 domain-containing protein n=1 Tax=Cephalotus follicularis TaxID=3775 RepID=A0A1Q3BL20_CEPFO|nr:RRM_1 domain-containing protein/SPOC domain-containing protein/RRM_5 domain-containing protein [Cephalotus follicularis]
MSDRGGRDRFRREFPSRSEEKSHSGRANAPPSRHLWVGNLSHSIDENDLTDHFLQFGELDSVAFQPGRSYAFINFKNDDDAIAALKALQGYPLAGNPLRIEFAKAEKSSTLSRNEDYLQRRDEQRSAPRRSPFSQRDSRARHASPEHFYPDKPKITDKNAEPSEVLWIGFPAVLTVDETILRNAFSPFGEIEKITAFPGRSYAFVRFRSVMSASRAKDTLQGRLFGNPRVHICFAKSESGSSNSGRSTMNTPLSPPLKSNGRPGSSENFRQDRNFGTSAGHPSTRSPQFNSNLDSVDSDVYGFNRGTLRTGGKDTFEPWRYKKVGSELGPSQDLYDPHISLKRERGGHLHDFPEKLPQKGSIYEDQWDLPEDPYFFHGTKKSKTGSFPPDNELPEYPFSDPEHDKHAFPRVFSNFSQPEAFDKTFEAGSYGYKQIPDRPMNLTLPHKDRSDNWKVSYDGFQVSSGSLPSNLVERKIFTPESDHSSLNEWKWEGTIAKGGTPVCRARCFPVGKVMDTMLPDFLDCTARTGLDMLAKHYYQAASAWVIFFVPESDADMGFYNEFMHYLGEKQRAAVAKLDDKTTLFLVPPSDFSEKVLKVPGKLSISGVVLRLEHPGSNFGSLPPSNQKMDTNLLSYDTAHQKQSIPSGSFPSMSSFPDSSKRIGDLSFLGNLAVSAPPASFSGSALATRNVSDSYNNNRHEYQLHERNLTIGPNFSPHHPQISIPAIRNIPSQVPNIAVDPTVQEHSAIAREVQQTSSSHNANGIPGIPLSGDRSSRQEPKPSVPLSMPIAALQPEQLAQLASSLLEQLRQSGSSPSVSKGEDFRQANAMNQSDNLYRTVQRYAVADNQMTSELSTSQFGQVPQLQQQQPPMPPQQQPPVPPPQQTSIVPSMAQRDLQTGSHGHQLLQSTGTQEEADRDQQPRLQATLQLAAALLQQIQQGKGT